MMTVTEIVEAIGHQAFARSLRVSPSAVSNMKADNCIPAKKYVLAVAACTARNLALPPLDLFSFDQADTATQLPSAPAVMRVAS